MKTNLSTLSNQDLCSRIVSLAAEERRINTELLRHLAEIERRSVHLSMGFPSLYAFLVKHLRYSEGAAGRRLQALRLMQGLPEDTRTQTMSKIESGDVTLSVLSTVQSFFRAEKKEGKTYTSTEKQQLLEQIEGKSQREVEYRLAEISPRPLPPEIEKPITGTQTQIQFVASQELMAKFEKLRQLLSHRNPNPSYAELFEQMADQILKRIDPERKVRSSVTQSTTAAELGDKAEPAAAECEQRVVTPSATAAESAPARSRYIPAAVRREVWIRDRGACTYRDSKSGRICGSRHRLQLDHRRAWAKDGTNTADNLTLRCQHHNLHIAREEFGSEKIAREIAKRLEAKRTG